LKSGSSKSVDVRELLVGAVVWGEGDRLEVEVELRDVVEVDLIVVDVGTSRVVVEEVGGIGSPIEQASCSRRSPAAK
jgi:hypothetical protein